MTKSVIVIMGIVVAVIFAVMIKGVDQRALNAKRSNTLTKSEGAKPNDSPVNSSSGKAEEQPGSPAMEFNFNMNQIIQDSAASKDMVINTPGIPKHEGLWLPLAVIATNLLIAALIIIRTRR